MSKDKYASIFLYQMEGIVFIIFQIFFATHTRFPSFSWEISSHVTRLDQLHVS